MWQPFTPWSIFYQIHNFRRQEQKVAQIRLPDILYEYWISSLEAGYCWKNNSAIFVKRTFTRGYINYMN